MHSASLEFKDINQNKKKNQTPENQCLVYCLQGLKKMPNLLVDQLNIKITLNPKTNWVQRHAGRADAVKSELKTEFSISLKLTVSEPSL